MICSNCKKENIEGRKYCFYCGSELTTQTTFSGNVNEVKKALTHQKDNNPNMETDDFSAKDKNKHSLNRKKIAIVSISSLLVLVCIIVIVFGATKSLIPSNNKTLVTEYVDLQADSSIDNINAEDKMEFESNDQKQEQKAIPQTTSNEQINAEVEYETVKKVIKSASYFKSASASSVLPDQAGHNYSASNVLKNDGKCWCEDASDYGEGEWIRLDLPEMERVSGLRIVNGYAGTTTQYEYNSKISELSIEFSDGRSTIVSLNVFKTNERNTIQSIRFNAPVDTDYIKLTINSVTKGECKDTCLTFVEPF